MKTLVKTSVKTSVNTFEMEITLKSCHGSFHGSVHGSVHALVFTQGLTTSRIGALVRFVAELQEGPSAHLHACTPTHTRTVDTYIYTCTHACRSSGPQCSVPTDAPAAKAGI